MGYYKILLISHERKMGGANLCLLELAKELKNRGHEVHVAVLFKGCPIDVALREEKIPVMYSFFGWWQQPSNWNLLLKIIFRLLHGFQFLSRKKIAAYVKKNEIQIIHSNSGCIDIGMQVSQITGIPHVWHFREYGMKDYNLEFMLGRDRSMDLVNGNSENLTFKKVLFISNALKEAYPEIEKSISQVVYDGVSKKYLIQRKRRGETPSFLIAGNLSKNKNQLLVLKAVKKLKDDGITKFSIKIAGESSTLSESKAYKNCLHKYVEDNHLDNVEFLGYVKDMKALRMESDIEIVASLSEAFGRVTVEGMLAGNPVIVSDTGANPELVHANETGLIFKSEDYVSLANSMKFFINNPNEIIRIGDNASIYAQENFTLERNVERIEKIYEELLG